MFVIKHILNTGLFVIENKDGVPVFCGKRSDCLAFLDDELEQILAP